MRPIFVIYSFLYLNEAVESLRMLKAESRSSVILNCSENVCRGLLSKFCCKLRHHLTEHIYNSYQLRQFKYVVICVTWSTVAYDK